VTEQHCSFGTPAARCGFTLVELLVVVGIIALLISILLPALSTARESAQNMTCKSSMRSLSQMHFSYTAESDGWMIKSLLGENARTDAYGRRWLMYLNSMHNSGVGVMETRSQMTKTGNGGTQLVACPSDEVASSYKKILDNSAGTSYIGNGHMFNGQGGPRGGSTEHFRLASVTKPAERLLITEKNGYWVGAWMRLAPLEYWAQSRFLQVNLNIPASENNGERVQLGVGEVFGMNHGNGEQINVAAADGHVQVWDAQRMRDSTREHQRRYKQAVLINPDIGWWRRNDRD
jgi:prepilin-type N-terminal cleavage/methylation domain-containing protein/prepilin-type processing-associated H-X9-DG protein